MPSIPADCCGCNCTACLSRNCCNDILTPVPGESTGAPGNPKK